MPRRWNASWLYHWEWVQWYLHGQNSANMACNEFSQLSGTAQLFDRSARASRLHPRARELHWGGQQKVLAAWILLPGKFLCHGPSARGKTNENTSWWARLFLHRIYKQWWGYRGSLLHLWTYNCERNLESSHEVYRRPALKQSRFERHYANDHDGGHPLGKAKALQAREG